MSQLKPGDLAPPFTLPDSTGAPVSLKDFASSHLIVYFYPAAMTPGCTIEAVDFSAAVPRFATAGYSIVGISPDTEDRLAQFIEQQDLGLTLLADPDHATIEAYGAWGTRQIWGKPIEGVIRSTLVLDVAPDGEATVARAYNGIRASGHVDRLRKDLGV